MENQETAEEREAREARQRLNDWAPIMADLEVLRAMRRAREAGDTATSQRIAEEIVAKMARENVGLAFGR